MLPRWRYIPALRALRLDSARVLSRTSVRHISDARQHHFNGRLSCCFTFLMIISSQASLAPQYSGLLSSVSRAYASVGAALGPIIIAAVNTTAGLCFRDAKSGFFKRAHKRSGASHLASSPLYCCPPHFSSISLAPPTCSHGRSRVTMWRY